ncbi:hypothetical protein [Hydrogenophaga atypica]|uniref:Uncharacterized protein n=1 Tax=Hydrogenophaga atypica TaxID=249409 RepID=A0ABW2QQM3_9BURK
MNLKLVAALLGAVLVHVAASANTLDLCQKAATNANRMGVVQKDKYTFSKSAACIPASPKHRFVYMLELRGLPNDVFRQIDFARDIKPSGLNQFCTDPDMRALLNAYDVDHRYYSEDGTFIGSILMQSQECGQRR